MYNAIGLLEFRSIAKGIEATDYSLKAANVKLIISTTVCPGKYITLFTGDVSAVDTSVKAGEKSGGEAVVDSFVIPNVHPSIIPAISGTSIAENPEAIGVIETFSAPSCIEAADAAVKAANVEIVQLRMPNGLGGKSFFVITGEVSAVKTAIERGAKIAGDKGLLTNFVVIPSPDKSLLNALL